MSTGEEEGNPEERRGLLSEDLESQSPGVRKARRGGRKQKRLPLETDIRSKDGGDDHESASDSDPLKGDYGNIALLLLLYTLQGIPMGLTGAMSLTLQERGATLSQLNLFGQVSWPFSLKLLWAPIVDACFVSRLGHRKTWLVPTQLLIGLMLLYTSQRIDILVGGEGGSLNVGELTTIFFTLFLLCATQDICVDGWALTLLSRRNVGYASTCNAVGQTAGNLLSYMGWMLAEKHMGFGTFILGWALVFLVTTTAVALLKRETSAVDVPTLGEVYQEMWAVLRNPAVRTLAVVLLTSKIAFSPEVMAQNMLIGPVGMPKDRYMFLGAVLAGPMLLAPKLVDRLAAGPRPFDIFMRGVLPRLALGGFAAGFYYFSPRPFQGGGAVLLRPPHAIGGTGAGESGHVCRADGLFLPGQRSPHRRHIHDHAQHDCKPRLQVADSNIRVPR